MSKPVPTHVTAQRGKRSGGFRGGGVTSELFDVFRRIDMHGGDQVPCWEWRGAHGLGTRGEYRPRVMIDKRDYYVYRIVYQLYTGHTLAPHEVVRHSCDHSWCCNPFHMLVGTQADNVQDMIERERVGVKHFHVRRIMQMLEIGCTAVHVAQKMKEGYDMQLDVSVIRKIKLRKVYKHIEWPWGDEYAKSRRERLRQLRLASDPSSAIIEYNVSEGKPNPTTTGETDD